MLLLKMQKANRKNHFNRKDYRFGKFFVKKIIFVDEKARILKDMDGSSG